MHNMPLLFAVIFLCVRGDGSFGHREDETRVITDASHTKWTARTQTQFGRVLVVMADNRRVEPVSGEGVQQYWSVSYELARRWACRHGYNITYYRFSEYHVLEKPTMSITGFQNPIAACRQASVGWREAAFCKLVAVGDALSQQNFDTVLWMDSDLFISRPELNLDDIVAQNPPLTCCKLYQTPPGECDACSDKSAHAELWLAQNWPWENDRPNSGFFIARRFGLVRELFSAWWHSVELHHNGIFEQHTLWTFIREGHWISKHIALMPIKAMTQRAVKENGAVRHIETSQRKNRVPVMQKALEDAGGKESAARCEYVGRVISFNATQRALELFPGSNGRRYGGERVVFQPGLKPVFKLQEQEGIDIITRRVRHARRRRRLKLN